MLRPLVAQDFQTYAFTVPIAPAAPLAPQFQITALIDSFTVTVPAAAANSIFIGGNPGVTITSGLELLAGTTTQFRVNNEGRQLYELQSPIRLIAQAVKCALPEDMQIPFICWDMSQIYVVAVAVTAISFGIFKAAYI